MRGYREKQQVMSESNRASERKESMNLVPGGDTRSKDGLRKRNICQNSKETARKVQRKPGMRGWGDGSGDKRCLLLTQ